MNGLGDERYILIKERLSSFTKEELQYIKDNIDMVCFDTYNYDEMYKTYCPIAMGMRLDTLVKQPTNFRITNEIAKRFNPVNILKGTKGNFYTLNRKEDLLKLLDTLICPNQP